MEWYYWERECRSRVEDQRLSLGHSVVRSGLGEKEGLTEKTKNTHSVGAVVCKEKYKEKRVMKCDWCCWGSNKRGLKINCGIF